MVLLAVLVIVVLLALAAYQYSDLMVSEYKAVVNAHRAAQAKAWADSGIHFAATAISSPDFVAGLNGNIFDNPDAFSNIAVGDEGSGPQGRFSLIAAPDPESGSTSWRFGFSDEAGKINVNAFMKRDPSGKELYEALTKLPNMTQEIAASIVDWLDADSQTREGGAENDYYSGAQLPYRCKNGPIDTIGELLLVKGIDRTVLYGNDLNGNGIQDADEEADPTLGFTRGLAAYLTVNSREPNTDKQGQALAYVNETDLQAYYEKVATGVSEDMAKFLIMYRQYGAANSSGQQQSITASINSLIGMSVTVKTSKTSTAKTIKGNLTAWQPDFNKKGNQKISSFFDLVNAQVSIPGKNTTDARGKTVQGPATVFDSPLKDKAQQRELLTELFQHMTIFAEADIPARINVNTAPREVLLAIPGITETDVEAILAGRPVYSSTTTVDPVYDTPAWLLTEAKMKTDTLKKLEKYVTTKTQVYRVQALGYSDKGTGPTARIEAVIDTNYGRPRIVMWRDLTELGSMKMMQP
jgi:type II secretory pathway component PulK